jgi:hypothetical protein
MKCSIQNIIAIALLILAGCKDNAAETLNSYSVQGTVITNGAPVHNATVSLNKRGDLTTATDSSGHFSLKSVPEGNYSLTVEKASTDGSFQSKTTNVSVTNDLSIKDLILPKGVKIQSPSEITANSSVLTWSPTDANDFREYKLYRHTSSGLDEKTGTLVHVATSIADTVFKDEQLSPLTKYYYRVYVMNDFGQLGGSNIVSGTTPNINLIPDGGFEDSSAFSNNWTVSDVTGISSKVSVTKNVKFSGNRALYFTGGNRDTVPYAGVRFTLTSSRYFPVVANTVYEISCMVKINGRRSNVDDGAISVYQGASLIKVLYIDGIPSGQNGLVTIDWTKFTVTFIAPSSTPIQVVVSESNESLWMDDLMIQPKP